MHTKNDIKNNFVFFLVKIQHTTHSVIPTEEERNYTKPSRRVSTWYTVSSPMVAQRSPVIRRPGSGCGSSSKLPLCPPSAQLSIMGRGRGMEAEFCARAISLPFLKAPCLSCIICMFYMFLSS